jgi:hypothetical protein
MKTSKGEEFIEIEKWQQVQLPELRSVPREGTREAM